MKTSQDIVNIKLPETGEKIRLVEVYSNFGRKVLTSHNTRFSVNSLKTGIYFVTVTTNKNVYKKVISVSK